MKKPKITVRSLKDLSLYNAYDVSKWCAKHGIHSVYLEYQSERIMEVFWSYYRTPCVVVRDSRTPGKVLKKFVQQGDETIAQTKARAVSYVEANYDIPMKWLPSLSAAFPAPAVDLLTEEIMTFIKVWGLNTHDMPPITISKTREKQIKADYPVPQAIRMKEKV